MEPARSAGRGGLQELDAGAFRRSAGGWLPFVLLLVLETPACGQSGRPSPQEHGSPNIILISVDTLRRDHVSAYGSSGGTTPALDRLAREGELFLNALSGSNWTLPAHMSLMTGLTAPAHGVEDDLEGLADSVVTLAKVLRKQGYRTCGFASHVYLQARYGFSRGFEKYEVRVDQPASQVTASALDWLKTRDDKPFFLFLHYFDLHWPFRPPPEFARRFSVVPGEAGAALSLFRLHDPRVQVPAEEQRTILALYDGEVAFTDQQIGLLLEGLRRQGVLDRTVVAIVSDHGEEFWDHGAFGHGTHLHGEVTRIPFLLRYPPRIEAGRRDPDLALLSDLPATLLSLAGLPVPAQFTRDGQDLLAPNRDASDRMVVLETTRWGPRRFAVRSLRYKLIGAGIYQPVAFSGSGTRLKPVRLEAVVQPPQLFDLATDPLEMRDLMGRDGYLEVERTLAEALKRHADRNVPGLRLSCTSSQGQVSYSGRVGLEGSLADDEFALLPGPDALVAPVSDGLFRFRLRPNGETLELVFPLAGNGGRMSLQLVRDGHELFHGAFSIPPPGGRRRVEGTPENGCMVWNPARPAWMQHTPVHLGQADLERLRSLGYAQ
ncbi:MAG: sulfatase [Acidobacteriota bacterium]